MVRVDDTTPEYSTNLADIRRVPLADVAALSEEMLNGALDRLMPQSPAEQVPVASFNSAI